MKNKFAFLFIIFFFLQNNTFANSYFKIERIRLCIVCLNCVLSNLNLSYIEDKKSDLALKAKEIKLSDNNKNTSSINIVKTYFRVPIHINKRKFAKICNFDDLKIERDNKNLAYVMHLSSGDNSKVRYRAKGQLIKNKKLVKEFNMNSNTIKANGFFEERKYLPSNLKEGDYTFRVILTYKNEKNENKSIIKEVNFSVVNSN